MKYGIKSTMGAAAIFMTATAAQAEDTVQVSACPNNIAKHVSETAQQTGSKPANCYDSNGLVEFNGNKDANGALKSVNATFNDDENHAPYTIKYDM